MFKKPDGLPREDCIMDEVDACKRRDFRLPCSDIKYYGGSKRQGSLTVERPVEEVDEGR